MAYANIVFMQEPEADSIAAQWLGNEGNISDSDLVEYLAQWDYGERDDISDRAPWGTADDTFKLDGYVVSYNRALNYVGLCVPLAAAELER